MTAKYSEKQTFLTSWYAHACIEVTHLLRSQNFAKNYYFLPFITQTSVCVIVGKSILHNKWQNLFGTPSGNIWVTVYVVYHKNHFLQGITPEENQPHEKPKDENQGSFLLLN